MAGRGVLVAVSPLQLITAFEYLAVRGEAIGEHHLVLCVDTVNGSNRNLPQLEAILKAYDVPVRVHWALWPRPTVAWLPHLKLARRRVLAEAAQEIGRADWLFLGSFKRHYLGLCQRLQPAELIISDDGTCLLRKTESEAFRDKVERFVDHAAAGRPLAASYFTCFRSDNLKLPVVFNDFRRLAGMATASRIVDEVHIIGSAFVTKKEYSEDVYLQALVHMVKLARSKGERIVYLPHRWETDAQLERIAAAFPGAFEIRRNAMPIELAYALADTVPRNVCGFSTTALVTLPMVLRDKPIRFASCQIDFSQSRMSEETIAGYRVLYDLIRDSIGADSVVTFPPLLTRFGRRGAGKDAICCFSLRMRRVLLQRFSRRLSEFSGIKFFSPSPSTITK